LALAERFCELVNRQSDIKVYAQAEDYETYATAKRLGADGVANFRTDVLFFKKSVNFALCDFVLSVGTAEETRARKRLHSLLERDFLRVFQTIDENYIAIRLCKHTMYEYFPKERFDVINLAKYILSARNGEAIEAKDVGLSSRQVEKMVRTIRKHKRQQEDYNPILGRRGVRLATTLPQIYEIEIRAILSAMQKVRSENKQMHVEILVPYICVVGELLMHVEILVPYICVVGELLHVRDLADRVASEFAQAHLHYDVAPIVEISGIAFEMRPGGRQAVPRCIRWPRLVLRRPLQGDTEKHGENRSARGRGSQERQSRHTNTCGGNPLFERIQPPQAA